MSNEHVNPVFHQTLAALDSIFPAMTAEQRLRAIVRAYDDCKDDPNARLPTVLSLLIEAAREHCGEGTQRAFKEDATG